MTTTTRAENEMGANKSSPRLFRKSLYAFWLWLQSNELAAFFDKGWRTRSIFSPTRGQLFCMMILAAVLGLASYLVTLGALNYLLYRAFRTANVFDPLLEQDSLAPPHVMGRMPKDGSARVLHFAMLHLGLFEALDNPWTYTQLSEVRQGGPNQFEFEWVFRAVEQGDAGTLVPALLQAEGDLPVATKENSTLALVTYLALSTKELTTSAAMRGSDAPRTASDIGDLLAESLADEGDTRATYTALKLDSAGGASWGWRRCIIVSCGVLVCGWGVLPVLFAWVDRQKERSKRATIMLPVCVGSCLCLMSFLPMPGSVFSPPPVQRGDQLVRALLAQVSDFGRRAQSSAAPGPASPTSAAATQPQIAVAASAGVSQTEMFPMLSNSTKPPEGAALHLRGLVKTMARLIDQLQADKDVKRWVWWLNVIRGPEQLVILVLFIASGLVLVERSRRAYLYKKDLDVHLTRPEFGTVGSINDEGVNVAAASWENRSGLLEDVAASGISEQGLVKRFAEIARRVLNGAKTSGGGYDGSKITLEQLRHERDRLQRDERRARWVIRWMAFAMPAVDFIGTVRGISAGLGGADSIVRESSPVGQAAAITDVTSMLGLAFATTVAALSLLLIVSFADSAVAAEEAGVIDDTYNAISPVLRH